MIKATPENAFLKKTIFTPKTWVNISSYTVCHGTKTDIKTCRKLQNWWTRLLYLNETTALKYQSLSTPGKKSSLIGEAAERSRV